MTQRRKGSAGWSTKTYKSPAWKYFHPFKYWASEYRKAKRAMHPGKVFLRVTSLDEVAKLGRTTTTRVNASTRQADLKRAAKKAAAGQKKTATKKTTGKRADPYAAALAIPARNRHAAAKMTKAAQPRKAVAKRKTDGSGQFDGSKSMNERDLTTWQRAQGGHAPPELLPRNARTRRPR